MGYYTDMMKIFTIGFIGQIRNCESDIDGRFGWRITTGFVDSGRTDKQSWNQKYRDIGRRIESISWCDIVGVARRNLRQKYQCRQTDND